jgi:hypothetical protein
MSTDSAPMMTYAVASYRKDRALVVFGAPPSKLELLARAICCNATTGYVRRAPSGATLVPARAQAAIEAHLIASGWRKAA